MAKWRLTSVAVIFVTGASLFAQTLQRPAPVFGKPAGAFLALSVTDVDATAQWYRQKLGFQLAKSGAVQDGKIRFALLIADDNIVELIQRSDAKSLASVAPSLTDPVQVHGVFKAGVVVADIDATYRALKERGVAIAYDLSTARDVPYRVFGIRDNEGNLLQFFGK